MDFTQIRKIYLLIQTSSSLNNTASISIELQPYFSFTVFLDKINLVST